MLETQRFWHQRTGSTLHLQTLLNVRSTTLALGGAILLFYVHPLAAILVLHCVHWQLTLLQSNYQWIGKDSIRHPSAQKDRTLWLTDCRATACRAMAFRAKKNRTVERRTIEQEYEDCGALIFWFSDADLLNWSLLQNYSMARGFREKLREIHSNYRSDQKMKALDSIARTIHQFDWFWSEIMTKMKASNRRRRKNEKLKNFIFYNLKTSL